MEAGDEALELDHGDNVPVNGMRLDFNNFADNGMEITGEFFDFDNYIDGSLYGGS